MRNIVLLIALFGVIALASARFGDKNPPPRRPLFDRSFKWTKRFRREAEPQGGISITGQKPLSGPDRRPSLDVDYNQRLRDVHGFRTDAYGGLNIRPGDKPQPHLGLKFERQYGNGFIGGFGQAQRGPGGRVDPSFGVNAGFRFRRDTDESKGSITIRGEKPLSGPDRRPSLDIDYNQRLHDQDGLRANAYGGVNIRPGEKAQPHLGLNIEREYGNGFIRGYSQAQRGAGGRIEPTFGVGGGFRFRRDTDESKGSITIRGEKPLSGPDRRPSLDIDYNQRLHDQDGLRANAYGGVNIRPGEKAQPHLGLNIEREYGNGFIRGYSQAQRGAGGRIEPTFGVGGGFRFRRDADDFQTEEEEH